MTLIQLLNDVTRAKGSKLNTYSCSAQQGAFDDLRDATIREAHQWIVRLPIEGFAMRHDLELVRLWQVSVCLARVPVVNVYCD